MSGLPKAAEEKIEEILSRRYRDTDDAREMAEWLMAEVCGHCGAVLPESEDENHYTDGGGVVCMGPRGGRWRKPITRAEFIKRQEGR